MNLHLIKIVVGVYYYAHNNTLCYLAGTHNVRKPMFNFSASQHDLCQIVSILDIEYLNLQNFNELIQALVAKKKQTGY